MVSSPDADTNTVIAKYMPNGFLTTIEVEPVGRWFLSHWERLNCARGLSTSGQLKYIHSVLIKNKTTCQNFQSTWINSHRTNLLLGHDASELSDSASEESEEEDDSFEDDITFLRSLDPKEAKDQDHYKVLGMSKLRYKATDEQIKKAYR